jgi:hypothetical protein
MYWQDCLFSRQCGIVIQTHLTSEPSSQMGPMNVVAWREKKTVVSLFEREVRREREREKVVRTSWEHDDERSETPRSCLFHGWSTPLRLPISSSHLYVIFASLVLSFSLYVNLSLSLCVCVFRLLLLSIGRLTRRFNFHSVISRRVPHHRGGLLLFVF